MSFINRTIEIESSDDSSTASFLKVEVPFKHSTSSSTMTNAKRAKTSETADPVSRVQLAPTSSYSNIQPIVTPAVKPARKPAQKRANTKPHALLWICSAGKGQSRTWKQKSLKVIGVYASKDDAERKKAELMNQYDCCGHGDILVGGTWEDEIDLVVRPIEEVCL
jgi:hypothetical protein